MKNWFQFGKNNKKVSCDSCKQEQLVAYRAYMDGLNEMLLSCKSIDDKLDCIELFQDIIRQQLKYNLMGLVLKHKKIDATQLKLFPDLDPEKHLGQREVSTYKQCIISIPYSRAKWKQNARWLNNREVFYHEEYRPKVYWFEPFQIGYINNNVHRLLQYQFQMERTFIADRYDLSFLFEKFDNDGIDWICRKTHKKIPVLDFRISLLFNSEKIKQKLLK